MEYEGKEVSPYKGVIGSCILLILFPLVIYGIFYATISNLQNLGPVQTNNAALGLGFGVGFIFHISCIIAGLFKGTLKVVINRVKTFFENLSLSKKLAFRCYWDDIKSEGIVFWIYFIIIFANALVSVYGLYSFFAIYFANL